MFTISIAVSGSVPFVLLFKSEETKDAALNAYEATAISQGVWLEDDFGQRALVTRPLALLFVTDLKAARESQIVQAVYVAETQMLAQQRASESPIIRMQQRAANSPGIMTSFRPA